MYSLYDFFADKKHVSKIISNRKKLIDDDVVKIELNLWYKSARQLLPYLVKNGYKVECYYKKKLNPNNYEEILRISHRDFKQGSER